MTGKGSARRPGTGYADNYDSIQWGRAKIIGPVIASDGEKHTATQNEDGSFSIERDALPPTGEPVSYRLDDAPEGQQATGWAPGMLQDDSYPLAHALSSKPDARQHVRDVAAQKDLEKQDHNA